MDWLRYANQGAVRNQPLSPELIRALSFVPEMGLQMEVFSGGQPKKGTSTRRVGSVRHDDGNAADVFFHKDGRRLDWSNPDDLPIFEEIVRKSRGAGITGIGAGPGYMRQGSMHIGFGAPVVWGADGRSKNAPEWLRNAYYGTEPGTVPAAPAVQMAGQPGQSAPANDPTPMLMAMFGGSGQGSAIGQAGADIPIPNAAPVAAPPPTPMRSTAPTPVQGQTAALAPTVAEGSGMAKTVSTTLAPTPQQLAQRQAMARALAQEADNVQVIRHPLQGVDKMAKSALAGYQQMKARQGETQRAEALASVIGGMGGTPGAYSQQQIAQAAAVDPKIAMGMVQQNRAMEAAAAEKAANEPFRSAQLEKLQLENDRLREPPQTEKMRTINQAAAAMGIQPGTPEHQQFVKEQMTKQPVAEVNLPGQPSKMRETIDKGVGGNFLELSTSGQKANRSGRQIDRLEFLLSNSPSGFEAGAKAWLGEFGVETEGLDALQAANAVIEAMVPEQRPPGSGPMSDADVKMFRNSLPGLINSPNGNALIIQTLRDMQNYDMEIGRIADMVVYGPEDGGDPITPRQARTMMSQVANPMESFRDHFNQLKGQDEPQIPSGMDPAIWEELRPEEKALFR